MEPKTRRQLWVLATLGLLLLAVLIWNIDSGEVGAPPTRRTTRGGSATATDAMPVDTVRLDALSGPRPEPGQHTRNPFRFRPLAPPTPVEPTRQSAQAAPAGPVMPDGPPPVPPIPLKFIGFAEQGTRLRLAVLSDGRNVFYGREGEIIDGRFRIVRIGIESIEMAYADGQGRQTIRLSGS